MPLMGEVMADDEQPMGSVWRLTDRAFRGCVVMKIHGPRMAMIHVPDGRAGSTWSDVDCTLRMEPAELEVEVRDSGVPSEVVTMSEVLAFPRYELGSVFRLVTDYYNGAIVMKVYGGKLVILHAPNNPRAVGDTFSACSHRVEPVNYEVQDAYVH